LNWVAPRRRKQKISPRPRFCPGYKDAKPAIVIRHLQIADTGRGDTPLVDLRWRCARCGHRRIDMICTGKDVVVHRLPP
jgi:hypothetical protein